MKHYRAVEIWFTKGGSALDGAQGKDFGARAAAQARVDKLAWMGDALAPHPRVDGKKVLLGAGGFKDVYVRPTPLRGAADRIDYVLAKLDLTAPAGKDPDSRLESAMVDVVASMLVLGQPRMTVYYSDVPEDKLTGPRKPRLCWYCPRVAGRSMDAAEARPLADGTGGTSADDVNRRLRYFLQLCAQVRKLHEAGFAHYDIKPANVMVDPRVGATVIDFGGLRRAWHPYSVSTRNFNPSSKYDPKTKQVLAEYTFVTYFIEQYKANEKRRRGAEAEPAPSLVAAVQAGCLSMERMKLIVADAHKQKTAVPPEALTFGVRFDIASLWQTALELGLWNDANEGAFREVANTSFAPAAFQALLDALAASYTGTEPLAQPGTPFDAILADFEGLETYDHGHCNVNESEAFDALLARRAVAAHLLAWQVGRREEGVLEGEPYIAAFALHQALARTGLYRGKITKGTTSKEATITSLINCLSWATTDLEIQRILTDIGLACLVNQGMWTKAQPTSFTTFLSACKGERTRPIINARWLTDPAHALTPETTGARFREIVLEKGALYYPAFAADDFKKANRAETLKMVGAHVQDPGAATRADITNWTTERALKLKLAFKAQAGVHQPTDRDNELLQDVSTDHIEPLLREAVKSLRCTADALAAYQARLRAEYAGQA
jgi:hypothetical protein